MIHITRGVAGSGKSTWVEHLVNSAPKDAKIYVFSADAHHMVDGVYRFDPARAAEAHGKCLREYARLTLRYANATIIVDNTNTSPWELSPYVQLAIATGVPYEVRFFPCDLQTAIERNIHNVPHSVIMHMLNNLHMPVPAHWNIQVENTGLLWG